MINFQLYTNPNQLYTDSHNQNIKYTKKELIRMVENYNKSHKDSRFCFDRNGDIRYEGKVIDKGFLGGPVKPLIN
jgi:hypothetical protein